MMLAHPVGHLGNRRFRDDAGRRFGAYPLSLGLAHLPYDICSVRARSRRRSPAPAPPAAHGRPRLLKRAHDDLGYIGTAPTQYAERPREPATRQATLQTRIR